MKTKLIITTCIELTIDQLQEVMGIVKEQQTSDRLATGAYELTCEHGTYYFIINEYNEVYLNGVE